MNRYLHVSYDYIWSQNKNVLSTKKLYVAISEE